MTDKKEFYRRRDVVDAYDAWRFAGAGGRYVDHLETSTVVELLQLTAPTDVLDLPCGTGRMLEALVEAGYLATGGDTSEAMRERTSARVPRATVVPADAFAMPFQDASFDAVVSLRFLFHVEHPRRFFSEVARVLRPGGVFVFDSLRWTPRSVAGALNARLGGALHTFRRDALDELLAPHGLYWLDARDTLALPSLGYRFVPDVAVPALKRVERRWPNRLKTKVFFAYRKPVLRADHGLLP